MPSVDLNCDLGRASAPHTIGMDAEVLPFVKALPTLPAVSMRVIRP